MDIPLGTAFLDEKDRVEIDKQRIVDLMQSSRSEKEWNANCGMKPLLCQEFWPILPLGGTRCYAWITRFGRGAVKDYEILQNLAVDLQP